MDDEADNTLDIVSTLSSPKSPSQQPPQSTGQEESLEDILTRSSGDLIRTFAASVSQSATREASKSEEFKQEIKKRLLKAIIDTYVWSTARLAHETESAEGRLAKGVQELLSADRDQDHLRARLGELMAAVGRALEMFG